MTVYHCCFLDKNNVVSASEMIEEATTDIAIEKAKAMLASRTHHVGVELWSRSRLVFSVQSKTAAVPPR